MMINLHSGHAIRPCLALMALASISALIACSRSPSEVSVSAFNYTDRPVDVYIDGAYAGYTPVGEGGGTACCHPWPAKTDVWVKWEYGGIEGETKAKYPPQSKKVRVPPLPKCWTPDVNVNLVAHIYPDHKTQLETLTRATPAWGHHAREVPLRPEECQVSMMGDKQ